MPRYTLTRAALSLVPASVWLAGAAVLLAAAGVWHWSAVSSARAEGDEAGAARVQGAWDKAEVDRTRHAAADALRNAERAMAASTIHEAERAAAARRLQESRHALAEALKRPVRVATANGTLQCPPGATLGDVVVDAAALQRVRDAGAPARPGAR
jgi:hypothetical protein